MFLPSACLGRSGCDTDDPSRPEHAAVSRSRCLTSCRSVNYRPLHKRAPVLRVTAVLRIKLETEPSLQHPEFLVNGKFAYLQSSKSISSYLPKRRENKCLRRQFVNDHRGFTHDRQYSGTATTMVNREALGREGHTLARHSTER